MATKREIKFRVFDGVDYMSTQFSLYDVQDRRIQFTKDVKIMQFIGLKYNYDGEDACEGDIIHWDNLYGEIIWSDDLAAFVFISTGGARIRLNSEYLGNFKKAGNIYQNPELLNGN